MIRKQSVLISLFISFLFLTISCKNQTESKNATAKVNDTEKTDQITPLTKEETISYMATGKNIAGSTFKALSSKLKNALKEGGVEEAAEYCNVVALPLTDSLSKVHHASIKRTSLKLRNTENMASTTELELLKSYEEKFKNKDELKAVVKASADDKVQFYAPIMTKTLCLTCHGTVGGELTKENYALLKSLYPEDEAIDYKENDLRGIWSIEMQRVSQN